MQKFAAHARSRFCRLFFRCDILYLSIVLLIIIVLINYYRIINYALNHYQVPSCNS